MDSDRKQDPKFVCIDAVSETKRDVIRDRTVMEADYKPFLTNRAMSYHPDSVFFAADMNLYPGVDSLLQFDYYMHSLRARRRRSSWFKPHSTEDEAAIIEIMGYNKTRAREAARVLSDDQLQKLKELTKRQL